MPFNPHQQQQQKSAELARARMEAMQKMADQRKAAAAKAKANQEALRKKIEELKKKKK